MKKALILLIKKIGFFKSEKLIGNISNARSSGKEGRKKPKPQNQLLITLSILPRIRNNFPIVHGKDSSTKLKQTVGSLGPCT